jgi:hypothetical protein
MDGINMYKPSINHQTCGGLWHCFSHILRDSSPYYVVASSGKKRSSSQALRRTQPWRNREKHGDGDDNHLFLPGDDRVYETIMISSPWFLYLSGDAESMIESIEASRGLTDLNHWCKNK